MKTADLPNEVFLAAVKQASADHPAKWAMRWDVQALLSSYPEKIVLSKARKLIKSKVIDGCFCGCRGDWEIREDNK